MNKFGYIKIAVAAPIVRVADCKFNSGRIIHFTNQATRKGVEIICFPELSITGCTCGDLFHQDSLIKVAEDNLNEILTITKSTDIIIIVGLPTCYNNKLFNSAAVLHKGKILAVIPKTYLPNHNEFNEKRYFSSGDSLPQHNQAVIELCGQSDIPFGSKVIIKNQGYSFAVEIGDDFKAVISPGSMHSINHAELIFHPSSQNAAVDEKNTVQNIIATQSARCVCGYVHVSSGIGESTTDGVFLPQTLVVENGVILSGSRFHLDRERELFQTAEIDIEKIQFSRKRNTIFSDSRTDEKYRTVQITGTKKHTVDELSNKIQKYPFINTEGYPGTKVNIEKIITAQTIGLAKRLEYANVDSAIIGVSGGLDSTHALMITASAMDYLNKPRTKIIAVTMPGFGTGQRTYQNAIKLMKLLGVTMREIDITSSCLRHMRDIGQDPSKQDVTFENIQARERTQILMDVANQENGIVVGTADLSEIALGWTTYNGDHMSMYSVNCGIPKTLLRFIMKSYVVCNEKYQHMTAIKMSEALKQVLTDIINTPISPELLPAAEQNGTGENGGMPQKTEEIVGPYDLHDFFLYYALRYGFRPGKILFLACEAFRGEYEGTKIKKWIKIFYERMFTQQFKRTCTPDGPKVGLLSLSPRTDFRIPSDGCKDLWLEDLEDLGGEKRVL